MAATPPGSSGARSSPAMDGTTGSADPQPALAHRGHAPAARGSTPSARRRQQECQSSSPSWGDGLLAHRLPPFVAGLDRIASEDEDVVTAAIGKHVIADRVQAADDG